MRLKKNAIPLAAVGLLMLFALNIASADEPSIDDLANLNSDVVPQASNISSGRAQRIEEAAEALGAHKGLTDRSKVLVQELESISNQLDQMYRFNALVNKDGLLPPVITESRDDVQASTSQIRTADNVYNVVVQARFVTTPPSWRDYLFVGLRMTPDGDRPSIEVLPKNDAERALWKEHVYIGYEAGKRLADKILDQNHARLDRDYLGELLYSELLNRGMFEEPQVAVSPTVVSGDRSHIAIGDTLHRITDQGGFVTDPKKWTPVVMPGNTAGSTASDPQENHGTAADAGEEAGK